jgi:hypothetical protein
MTTITLGTTIINHTIKNEIQKIEYMLERAILSVHRENRVNYLPSSAYEFKGQIKKHPAPQLKQNRALLLVHAL